MITISIFGASGRMGRAIALAAEDRAEVRISGLKPDVFVDFSVPAALAENLGVAVAGKKPILIGTTGLGAEHVRAIDSAADHVPVIQAANTSLGITLLNHIVREAAARLGDDWDIEIVEMHHRLKVDAPSGTALMLGAAAAQGRGVELEAVRLSERDGIGDVRAPGGIGFASLRGGSVAGEHQVIFAAEGERLELGHRAESRAIFARGAITAAQWLVGKPPGRYTMADVARPCMSAQADVDKAQITEFYRRLADRTPAPETELDYVNHFTLLVAVVLSAQATDASVNRATRTLFETVNSPTAMLELGEDRLREAIKTIGLFNTKAKNIIALSEALIRDHGGEVPADRDALQKLPGVGRKTANVVMNCAFGAETFAVDTHVFRVSNRTGLAPGKDVLAVELKLDKVTPPPYRRDAHHLLILHGRYVCKARAPECWRCVVADLCRYRPKTLPPGSAPPAKPKLKAAK